MQRREFVAALASLPVASLTASCTNHSPPRPAPSQLSYGDAVSLAEGIIRADANDPKLLHSATPRLYVHGKPAEHAVALFHGFTNSPQQFDELARGYFALGCNVFVPRIPHHGLKERLTRDLAHLTVDELHDCADVAFSIVRGLGRTTGAVGLSLGGTMVLWLTQMRPLDLAVPVAPFLMPMNVPQSLRAPAAHALAALPDMYWFWDSKLKERSLPLYRYPGYPSQSMARVLSLAGEISRESKVAKPQAKNCVLVLNSHENAISNEVALDLLFTWNGHGAGYRYLMLKNLGAPRHDIIDPTTFPIARTKVYPVLENIVLGRSTEQHA